MASLHQLLLISLWECWRRSQHNTGSQSTKLLGLSACCCLFVNFQEWLAVPQRIAPLRGLHSCAAVEQIFQKDHFSSPSRKCPNRAIGCLLEHQTSQQTDQLHHLQSYYPLDRTQQLWAATAAHRGGSPLTHICWKEILNNTHDIVKKLFVKVFQNGWVSLV